mmetsp:Transcript_19346/g.59737  ORF Transcript_19346/g.59737 Transcript_19346/m.59737 type:complete len:271 (+) Transcript_19346:118-930(+)
MGATCWAAARTARRRWRGSTSATALAPPPGTTETLSRLSSSMAGGTSGEAKGEKLAGNEHPPGCEKSPSKRANSGSSSGRRRRVGLSSPAAQAMACSLAPRRSSSWKRRSSPRSESELLERKVREAKVLLTSRWSVLADEAVTEWLSSSPKGRRSSPPPSTSTSSSGEEPRTRETASSSSSSSSSSESLEPSQGSLRSSENARDSVHQSRRKPQPFCGGSVSRRRRVRGVAVEGVHESEYSIVSLEREDTNFLAALAAKTIGSDPVDLVR